MPKLSLDGIAKKIQCTTSFVKRWVGQYERLNNVEDNTRTGRPPLGKKERSSADQRGWNPYGSTSFWEIVRGRAPCCQPLHSGAGSEVGGPQVLAPTKEAEVIRGAQAEESRLRKKKLSVDWTGVAMSDSKYFYAQPTHSSPAARWWQLPAGRDVVEVVKYSAAVHGYMAVTAFGSTQLIIVTGGKQKPPHGKKFFDKSRKNYLRGVGEEEYRTCVLPKMLIDINNLFQPTPHALSWIFQQDGAPAHTAACTKQMLGRVLSPTRLMLDWPPNSPDLSWIENIWAWMDRQLRERPDCKTENELIKNLLEIWDSIPLTMLQHCAAGMRRRMEKVLEKKGEALNY